MLHTFVEMLKMILVLLKYPVIFCAALIGVWLFMAFVFYCIGYLKGRRVNRGSVRKMQKRSFLLRLFYDAPKQYVEDQFNTKPDFFRPQGLIIFTGPQGHGKSISMMQYAIELHDTYPLSKCLSNTAFVFQDAALKHWRQLIDFKNEQKGVVVIMDELQNWFSSNQSRNFPPEMLSVITQNRKNRRVILGTAQNFYLLAKPIRSQCTEIRECITLAGVLTIVIRREPKIDNEGECKEMKYRGMYFFVHNKRIRESYDTWAVIDNLKKSGFHDNPFLKEVNQESKAE